MPDRRRKLFDHLSLRARAALLSVLLFCVFYGVVVLGAWMYVGTAVTRDHDTGLLEATRALANRLQTVPREEITFDQVRAALPRPRPLALAYAAVRQEDGTVLAFAGTLEPYQTGAMREFRAAPRADAQWLGDVQADNAEDRVRDSQVRVATARVRHADGDPLFVQIGIHPGLLAQAQVPVFSVLLYSAPVALVAAFCAGWFLAGYTLRPVRQVMSAVSSIAPDRLGLRFSAGPSEASELVALKDQLNAAMERLQHGYQAQDRFISNVAHDLKTPIASVLLESQVIQMAPASEQEYIAYAQSVQDEMRRLGRLVESFLMLARSEKSLPTSLRVEVNVNDFVTEAVRHYSNVARLYHVTLRTQLHELAANLQDLKVIGDADLLRTMVENIVHNAIKFSPRNGTVDVEVRRDPREVRISVRDRGPGIPPDLQSAVFERFTQAPQEAERMRGTGLGLAIARSVAQLHGGRISAQNSPEGGCVFEICLPAAGSGDEAKAA